LELQKKVTAKASAFAVENSAKKVCVWGARPTRTPFLRNLSPRLSSNKKITAQAGIETIGNVNVLSLVIPEQLLKIFTIAPHPGKKVSNLLPRMRRDRKVDGEN